MKQALKLLAPSFAVGVFWCYFSNGWLALLAYHLQILLWSRRPFPCLRQPAHMRMLFMLFPSLLAGPLLYGLLPYITRTDLSAWLAAHQLSRFSLTAMIPYFGLVHPLLEQLHWAPLREQTPLAHLLFSGYHLLVLSSLLTPLALMLSFVVLVAASFLWQQMARKSGTLAMPVASHILADLGLVIAAWLAL